MVLIWKDILDDKWKKKKELTEHHMWYSQQVCVCICGYEVYWLVKDLHIHYSAWIPTREGLWPVSFTNIVPTSPYPCLAQNRD